MPDTTKKPIDAEHATVAWNDLAERADALIEAWQGDHLPPNLADYLPAEPPLLRRMALNEFIKIDLEYRWQQHELPKQIEEYVEEFPELVEDGQVSCDLIYEEFHIRQQTDDPPAPETYYKRFPGQTERLKRMMSIEPNRMGSTTMIGGQKGAEIDVGQQIDDFDLLLRLGKGSFGSVFLARQRSMQRLVALKISRDRGTEPQTLAMLDHPYIVRVYDQRVLHDRKLQLMYMQHIPGGTLQDVVEAARRQAPALRSGKTVLEAVDRALNHSGESPPEGGLRRRLANTHWPEAACWIGAKLAAALEYAHQRGVLHRDVKPANVLLAADCTPKLVDFNVSFSSKLEGATPAAYFGGSLAYMSPEQLEATNPDHEREPGELDGKSDVYSLGVMLWELLTGTRPFGEEHMEKNWSETLKILTDRRRFGVPVSAIAALPPDLPPALQNILLSCLAPHATNRPTAGQLARQLELCLQPRVQSLLIARPKSLRQWMRRYPFWCFVALGLVPSAVFSTGNLILNKSEFVPKGDEIKNFFEGVEVPVVNFLSFGLAIGVVFRFAWPVLYTVRKVVYGNQVQSEPLPQIRLRALHVGDCAGWFGFALWMISGIVFPGWMHLRFGNRPEINSQLYANFIASQFASGGISSTLTFFLLSYMCVRAFYPVLIRPEQACPEEVENFIRLECRCRRAFGWAVFFAVVGGAVPMFLMLSMEKVGEVLRVWMILLSVAGLLSCFAAWKMLNAISSDLSALAIAVDPTRESSASAGTDTVESFWTGTR
ncbi:MAG: serine/threonine protein kinase [Pirellulales bacterium]|nr:serine/threonine protein kinase [Pirellulales bacterium]